MTTRGFTLVELMVSMAVALILIGIAVPSFDTIFNSGRIASQANDLVATLQLARMEAIRRNTHVVVCASTNGTSCTNTATWTGWLAFVDDGGGTAANASNGTVDSGETILRVNTVDAKVTVKTSSNISGSAGGAFTFRSDGLARGSSGALLDGMVSVCVPKTRPLENVRNVSIAAGSRVAVSRFVGGGACAVPTNS